MTLFLTYVLLVLLWTTYISFRTYSTEAKRGLRADELTAPYRANRPYLVGFLITNVILFPFAFILSLFSGVLNDDLTRLFSKKVVQ